MHFLPVHRSSTLQQCCIGPLSHCAFMEVLSKDVSLSDTRWWNQTDRTTADLQHKLRLSAAAAACFAAHARKNDRLSQTLTDGWMKVLGEKGGLTWRSSRGPALLSPGRSLSPGWRTARDWGEPAERRDISGTSATSLISKLFNCV